MTPSLRFCASPGCSTLVPKGRCPHHARLTAHQRGYTTTWAHFRNVVFPTMLIDVGIYLPVCGSRLQPGPHPWSECAKTGTMTLDAPLELDHEPPLHEWERADPAIVCDPHRVGFLCQTCHSRKTRREGASVRS